MKSCFAALFLSLGMVSAAYGAEPGKSPLSPPAYQKVRAGGFCKIYGPEREAWTCDHLGNVTIRQIYERGWRVVALVESARGLESKMVIEEQ